MSKSMRDYVMFDSSLATEVDAADVGIDLRVKYRIQYYFSTLDIVIGGIEERFDSQAANTVRYMSAMCIWKDRRPEDNDSIRQLATMYHLDSDLCSNQYDLLRNDPSLKAPHVIVNSLPSLVAHMYSNKLHESYCALYHLACILLTIPVSSASCERAFSKLSLVKNALRSTMTDDRLCNLLLMAVEKNVAKELNLQIFVDVFALQPRKLKL